MPFWQLLKILKNCQNGTFLPMHENQKFFGPNYFIWSAMKVPFYDFIQNVALAPSMCSFKWIKMDKFDYLKIGSRDFKNSFYFGIVWFSSKPGMCQKLRLVKRPFNFRLRQCGFRKFRVAANYLAKPAFLADFFCTGQQ